MMKRGHSGQRTAYTKTWQDEAAGHVSGKATGSLWLNWGISIGAVRQEVREQRERFTL